MNEESSELRSLKNTFDHWTNLFGACLSHGSEIQCLVKLEEISRKMSNIENDFFFISDTAYFGRLQFDKQKPSLPILNGINFHTGKVKVLFKINITGHFISGILY